MPSSGRWVVLFTGRVSPPRRRVPFCTGRKEPKSRQGVGAIGRNGVAAPASMPPTPWTPVYGGYPLGRAKHFRRAKSEWLSAISSGPLGPGFLENWSWCDSTTAPGVAEPTCLVRNTGYLNPPPSGAPSPLGEGVTRSVTDEVSGQRPPAAGLGPAPTRKMGPSLYPCRGGCPHPPAVPLSPT